jgi:hypothetical protein
MALNFGLLGDAGAPAMGYLQGQQDVARNQLAQQQIETGRMTQDKMRMEMDAMNRRQAGLDKFMARAKELGVDGDPEQLTQNYAEYATSTGNPQEMQAAQMAVQAARERKAYMAGQPSAAPAQGNALAGNRLSQIENRLIELRQFPTAGKQERDELTKEREKLTSPQNVAAGGSIYDPATGKFNQAPEKTPPTPAPPAMVAEYTFAKTPDGGGFQGSYQQFVTARAAAGRAPAAPAAPRPEQPPVAVVDPVTGKPVLVTREQSFGMTPASAMEGLPPKEIQARESKFPAATSAVKTFESSAEKLATDLERLATHPGLSGISGLVYGRTPAITKDARAAQALYDSIVARGGFQELQNMRASSPTGGALGNVSNQEGQYLRDAFAPINRTQDTTDLSRSLKDAANATRTSKQRVRDAYDMTYEYKTGGSAAPKPSAVAPNIDALLQKYK